MKKFKYWILLIFVLIFISIVMLVTKKNTPIKQSNSNKDSINVNKVKTDTIPSNWKTYSSSYGFTFQYPDTWDKSGKDAEVINLSGITSAFEINYIDTISNSTFLLGYHPAPNGAELYRYAVSQFESSKGWYEKDAKKIEVDGNIALEANILREVDGRGNLLNPPNRLIIVDFLDKQKTGEIELQFRTSSLNDNIEVAKFKMLLTTFRFSN